MFTALGPSFIYDSSQATSTSRRSVQKWNSLRRRVKTQKAQPRCLGCCGSRAQYCATKSMSTRT